MDSAPPEHLSDWIVELKMMNDDEGREVVCECPACAAIAREERRNERPS